MPAEGRGGGKREAYDSENISENSDRYEHGEGTADSSRWTPLAGVGNRDETVDWDEVFRTIDHQTSWPSQQPQDHQVPQNLAPWGPAHARNNRPVVSILHNAADRQTGQVHPGPHQIRRSTLELALALEGGPGEIERYIWSNSPQLPSIPPQQPSHSPCPSEQAGPRRSQSFPSYGPEDPSPFTLLASTGAVYNDFDQRSPEALRQRPPPNLHGSGNPPFQEHRPTAGPSRLPPLYTPPPLDVTTPSSYDGAFLDWEPSPFGTTPMVSSAHHDPSPAIGAIGFGQPLPPQPYLPTGSSSRSAHLGSRVDSVPSTPVSSTPRSSSGMPPPPTRAPLGRHQSAGQANQSSEYTLCPSFAVLLMGTDACLSCPEPPIIPKSITCSDPGFESDVWRRLRGQANPEYCRM